MEAHGGSVLASSLTQYSACTLDKILSRIVRHRIEEPRVSTEVTDVSIWGTADRRHPNVNEPQSWTLEKWC